jgi:hypothetical protein
MSTKIEYDVTVTPFTQSDKSLFKRLQKDGQLPAACLVSLSAVCCVCCLLSFVSCLLFAIWLPPAIINLLSFFPVPPDSHYYGQLARIA